MDQLDNKKEQKNNENHIRTSFIIWIFLSFIVFSLIIIPQAQNLSIALNGAETTGTVLEVRRPRGRNSALGSTTIHVQYFTGDIQQTARLYSWAFSTVRTGDTIALSYLLQNPTSITMRPAWFSASSIILSVGTLIVAFFVMMKNENEN